MMAVFRAVSQAVSKVPLHSWTPSSLYIINYLQCRMLIVLSVWMYIIAVFRCSYVQFVVFQSKAGGEPYQIVNNITIPTMYKNYDSTTYVWIVTDTFVLPTVACEMIELVLPYTAEFCVCVVYVCVCMCACMRECVCMCVRVCVCV